MTYPKVHLDRGDSRARCGRPPGVQVTADEAEVTCAFCHGIINGTHGIGCRQPDQPCGTLAAYRRHHRHGEPPCRSCRQAKARFDADMRRAA
jgi:hypothetical protein